MKKKVMITGVYGLIAGAIYNHLQAQPEQYELYALARRRQDSERVAAGRVLDIPDDRFFLSDLTDLDVVTEALQGIDVVVHMAADPSGAGGWESVLTSNLIGAYHIFEGAKRAGVQRVIFASSIQVSHGYRLQEPYASLADNDRLDLPADIPLVTHEWPPAPPNIYASSKVWGEALAKTYSISHGLSCICLRIGWVVAEDKPRAKDIWCSQRDIVQLTEKCINAADDLKFDIFYGMSDNKWRWVDIDHAREAVGYVAQDRAEDHWPNK